MLLRRAIVPALLLALLPALVTAAPAWADDPVADKLEAGITGPTRVIVEVTSPVDSGAVALKAADEDAEVVLNPAAQPFIVVEGTGEELASLAEDPRVVAIHRDRAYPPAAVASSNLSLVGADQAHAAGATGAGQAIAVLDTGIDRDHPAFAGRIADEACFSAVDEGVQSLCPNGASTQLGAGAAEACAELCFHGSHVAGIATAVAPGAQLLAVQVFSRIESPEDCGGEAPCVMAFESSIRLALDYVAASSLPIAAVNLSLGGMPYETSCDDAVFKPKIDALLARGTATVVAAGNESFEGASFPACVSSAVAVGASDSADGLAPFSNHGPLLDLLAPGVDITSAVPDNATDVLSGTSMAAPHVAGALAVLKARSPDQPVSALVDRLTASGRPIAYPVSGGESRTPRLDVYAALTGAPPSSAPSGPTPTPSADSPAPTPVPLPTITVTVTVTVTPPGAASVCTRGTARTRLTPAQWAKEIHRSTGSLSDATLSCYLRLVQKASQVFPEVTKASTLGTAYRVLRAGKTSAQRMDRALLTGWLNWARGVNGTSTLRTAERVRLAG
ncbi:S8 family peptidase [Thermoactinospora rubra]|uniref:S8 family peptidase n=1 Tax=Thermoactinospora rubra TaxID=1088767 RepID=UPI000A0F9091|nr:S8 family serine peptidase [Thermoactinospora rubra]